MKVFEMQNKIREDTESTYLCQRHFALKAEKRRYRSQTMALQNFVITKEIIIFTYQLSVKNYIS